MSQGDGAVPEALPPCLRRRSWTTVCLGSTVTCNRVEGFLILLHDLTGFEIPGTQCSPSKHPA